MSTKTFDGSPFARGSFDMSDSFQFKSSGRDPHGGGTNSDLPGPDDWADPASNHIRGTDDDDNIIGTNRRDVIYGLDGDDIISAKEGDDVVFGGRGNDTIFGGEGNDWLSGGAGNDVLFGGTDGWQNILNGGAGSDAMFGSIYSGVSDVFQFTRAEDSDPKGHDYVYGFTTGVDKIHLTFDADEFKPGHQTDFDLVSKDQSGVAGTMWVEEFRYDYYGEVGVAFMRLHGHTNNDGVADFMIEFRGNPSDNIDWGADMWAEDMLKQSDFIFG